MVLWRCDLSASWRTQLLSLLIYGGLIFLTLIIPWPTGYEIVWLSLLTLVMFGCIRSQNRIALRRGEIVLLESHNFLWHKHEWYQTHQPWMLQYGVMLRLRQVTDGAPLSLWLASDSMSDIEWRQLCMYLHQMTAESPVKRL